jgi:hypothetical protein
MDRTGSLNYAQQEKEYMMKTYQSNARLAGILYILGTVFGVLSLVVYGDLFTGEDYLTQIAANPSQLTLGSFFVLLMGISLSAMGIFLYPIFKKEDEALAMGMVVFRSALEGSTYILLVVSRLFLVLVGKKYAVADASASAALRAFGDILVDAPDLIMPIVTFSFLIGAGLLYTLFYRSRLIPRWLSVWGLVGILPYLAVDLFKFFGSPFNLEFLYGPLAIQEMVMGLWLVFKGFDRKAVEALDE